VCKR
jgi:hypothetical protein